jgi:hypothetical protein
MGRCTECRSLVQRDDYQLCDDCAAEKKNSETSLKAGHGSKKAAAAPSWTKGIVFV